MQKIIFDLLFPIEKKVEKIFTQTQKRIVFIFENVKLGVGLYFSGDISDVNRLGLAFKVIFKVDAILQVISIDFWRF
jgi:hypothetical protein